MVWCDCICDDPSSLHVRERERECMCVDIDIFFMSVLWACLFFSKSDQFFDMCENSCHLYKKEWKEDLMLSFLNWYETWYECYYIDEITYMNITTRSHVWVLLRRWDHMLNAWVLRRRWGHMLNVWVLLRRWGHMLNVWVLLRRWDHILNVWVLRHRWGHMLNVWVLLHRWDHMLNVWVLLHRWGHMLNVWELLHRWGHMLNVWLLLHRRDHMHELLSRWDHIPSASSVCVWQGRDSWWLSCLGKHPYLLAFSWIPLRCDVGSRAGW